MQISTLFVKKIKIFENDIKLSTICINISNFCINIIKVIHKRKKLSTKMWTTSVFERLHE